MEKEQYKSYNQGKTIHKISIWNHDASRTFLYMSCEICRYNNRCKDIKHKSDICTVAQKTEKLFSDFLYGRVSSFLSDEFFIDKKYTGHSKIEKFKKIVKYLRMKYILDPNENAR